VLGPIAETNFGGNANIIMIMNARKQQLRE
jgi:hypothetical protein